MTKQEFLATSLPYDLVGITQNRLVKINGINYENQLPIIWDSINKEKSDFSGISGFGIMLILRPLSDLTKPIEHKGEKFVPMLKMVDKSNTEWDKMKIVEHTTSHMIDNHKWYKVVHETLGEILSINPQNILVLPFCLIKMLIEWHFDIADLLSKGEAINVNTLEVNPYK